MKQQDMNFECGEMESWRLLVPDPVAVKFLENEDSVRVIEPSHELIGFELYIVEQWACSRTNLTIAIVTFTGQTQHKINVAVIEITKSNDGQPSRVESYLQSAVSNHARQQSTRFGVVMVTNLSVFPSTLTILFIPDGDIRKHRVRFILNENLKRLACSGRAGISLSEPTEATLTRFQMLYQTSDRIPPADAVIELVQICQIALSMFTKLRQEFCDGLFCDLTHAGLNNWWTEMGSQYYNIEPNDGALGPTTVAALLGLFLGARNRLSAQGAPMPKNAFDIHALKRGIAQFQKAQKLKKSRRLDHLTLRKIHKVTAKAAYHEGWTVPRAVKSTVAELGKGGEMVMGMVGAKDKFGIADVETTDFDQFLKRLYGEHCKWLWKGKNRKSYSKLSAVTLDAPLVNTSDNYSLLNESSSSEEDNAKGHLPYRDRQNMVGQSFSVATSSLDRNDLQNEKIDSRAMAEIDGHDSGLAAADSRTFSKADFTDASEEFADDHGGLSEKLSHNFEENSRGCSPQKSLDLAGCDRSAPIKPFHNDFPTRQTRIGEYVRSKNQRAEISKGSRDRIKGRSFNLSDKTVNDVLRVAVGNSNEMEVIQEPKELLSLRHSKSLDLDSGSPSESPESALDVTEYAMPGDVLIDCWKEPTSLINSGRSGNEPYIEEEHNLLKSKWLFDKVSDTMKKSQYLNEVQSRNNAAVDNDIELLKEYLHGVSQMKSQQADSDLKAGDESVREIREILLERTREVEARQAKLEYELGVLTSKIGDVEDGVANLDRQVSELESRGRALDADSRDQTWENWIEALIRRIGIV